MQILPVGLLLAMLPPAAFAAPLEAFLRKGDHVVFLGDDMTAASRYVAIVRRMLKTAYPNAGIRVVDLSQPGKLLADSPGLLNAYVQDEKPTVAVMMYGPSDAMHGDVAEVASARDFTRRMQKLVKACRRHGLEPVLLRAPIHDSAARVREEARLMKRQIEFLAAQDAWAGRARVPVIDVQSIYASAIGYSRDADPLYTFSRDGVRPLAPGSAAIAGAVVRAFGIGLALAPDTRGPLRRNDKDVVDVSIASEVRVLTIQREHPIRIKLMNAGEAPAGGRLTVFAGDWRKRQSVSGLMHDAPTFVDVSLPLDALAGRADCVPIVVCWERRGSYATAQSVLHHSRIVDLTRVQFAATEQGFHLVNGPRGRACPVKLATVRIVEDQIEFGVTWRDETPAYPWEQANPAPFGEYERSTYDSVTILLDMRDTETSGRHTMDANQMTPGVARIILSKWKEENDPVRMFVLPDFLRDRVHFTPGEDGAATLRVSTPLQGRSFGFDIIAADSAGKGQPSAVYSLAGRPVADPTLFIRMSAKKSGIFYRTGY